jgi:ubiquinone/menaquinone biosynthesis C-methylase UbiE
MEFAALPVVQTWAVPDRDVEAFDDRADVYESGWRGRLHQQIADEVAAAVLGMASSRSRILDVGCGTGYLLRELAAKLPAAQALCGVDPAPTMIEVARSVGDDPRLSFLVGFVERLPYQDETFDLVVSTTSFDHWRDQQRGLAECARVLEAEGRLVLADLFSPWLVTTLIGSRRKKARTQRRLTALLTRAGFDSADWHPLKTPLITAVEARKV